MTSIGEYTFRGCTGLTSVTIPNSVTSIGSSAFKGCTGLTSVTIPNSVTSIGSSAFAGCTGLTSVTIPRSVTSVGSNAFDGCTGLTKAEFASIESLCGIRFDNEYSNPLYYVHHLYINGEEVMEAVIPESVTSIRNYAFSGCEGLTAVTIPNSVTSIGDYTFNGCTGLKELTIADGEGTLSLGYNTFTNKGTGKGLFYDCPLEKVYLGRSLSYTIHQMYGYSPFYYKTKLRSVTIGSSVTSFGGYAFWGCPATITLPESVTSIGSNAFNTYATLYVKRGTTSLLTLWNAGYTPYETGTVNKLEPTKLVISTTQTTATVNVENVYKEYQTTWGDGKKVENGQQILTGLRAGDTSDLSIYVSNDTKTYSTSASYTTQPISPTVTIQAKSASSVSVAGSYIKGDAEVSLQQVCINGTWIEADKGKLTGLNPNQSVKVKFSITAGDYTYTSSEVSVTTDALTLETQQPKVISEGNVIVAATSNLDDEEQNVGFEWRRQDWNDDFDSKTGGAYLYEGQIEGYIRSLNSNYLWKFRPYYEANDGTRYYGEWKGLDPSDFSYFDPTVHTYAKIEVNGNVASVRGYAQRGTDNIASQGFRYWRNTNGVKAEGVGHTQGYAPTATKRAGSVPRDAQTVEATGTVMEAELKGLDYETTYSYVAFVTTSEGETFYGEEKTFTTGEDLTGVEDLTPTLSQGEGEPAIYDLNGRRLARMQRGINIVRMSDGTVRKVMVK